MRKRYKIVLNVDIDDPEKPYPAGGDYTYLNRIQGVIHNIVTYYGDQARITLDKVIDKGEISES